MYWQKNLSIFNYFKSRQIANALSLNPKVLARLSSHHLWPNVTSSNEQCCVLSVWIEDTHGRAREVLSPESYISALAELKQQVIDVLGNYLTVVSIADGLCIQTVFSDQFSGQDFVFSAVDAAENLMKLIDDFRASGDRLSSSDEKYQFIQVKLGLALGDVASKFVKSRSTYEYLASGQAVVLSRLLSAERQRLDTPVLLTEEVGKLIDKARPLDLYRTPGATAEKTLYGLQLPQSDSLDPQFKETYIQALNFLYNADSVYDDSTENAISDFEKCLLLVPGDEPAKQMLSKTEEISKNKKKIANPKIRGYFAV
jgi:hypothetical protein